MKHATHAPATTMEPTHWNVQFFLYKFNFRNFWKLYLICLVRIFAQFWTNQHNFSIPTVSQLEFPTAPNVLCFNVSSRATHTFPTMSSSSRPKVKIRIYMISIKVEKNKIDCAATAPEVHLENVIQNKTRWENAFGWYKALGATSSLFMLHNSSSA